MRRSMWLVPAVLLVLTAVMAVWHLNAQPKVTSGTVFITAKDVEKHLRLEKLEQIQVRGELVDGKGEKRTVTARGTELVDAISSAGLDAEEIGKVTIVASDGYCAEISGEELRTEGKAYLLLHGDSAELIVFGDENRKRNVANVMYLEVE